MKSIRKEGKWSMPCFFVKLKVFWNITCTSIKTNFHLIKVFQCSLIKCHINCTHCCYTILVNQSKVVEFEKTIEHLYHNILYKMGLKLYWVDEWWICLSESIDNCMDYWMVNKWTEGLIEEWMNRWIYE